MKRRADVVGIFPNEASITRLVGDILLEHNDEWQLQHRYLTLETMAGRTYEQLATQTHIAACPSTEGQGERPTKLRNLKECGLK